jgi:hypothetical protein
VARLSEPLTAGDSDRPDGHHRLSTGAQS